VKLAFDCAPEETRELGLTCTEDQPCAVYLELAAVESTGLRLLLTGNLHTENTTLYGILLSSDDGGKTWTEPVKRTRNTALDQIEFLDFQTGWVSGVSLEPFTRNPFLLLTTDGGKLWQQRLVVEDQKFGSISQFHFDSKTHGRLIVDTSQGRNKRQELYESNTGGESWELKEVSAAIASVAGPAKDRTMRVRTDGPAGLYRVERGSGRVWETVASFVIRVADCKGD
jgi:photosystem II stability/assembly factor-like uncharacterized protein